MGVFAISAFVAILFSSFYFTYINACSRSTSQTNHVETCQTDPVEYVESVVSLDYYNADDHYDECIVCHWHSMVSTSIDESESIKLLEDEANDKSGKPSSRMSEYLQRARRAYRCVSGLTRAECLVVIMYTDDGDANAFYKEYTWASKSRRWRQYKIYTTLLVSALKNLAKNDPIPQGATLYRGIKFRPGQPKAGRVFLNAFSSASLDIEVAKEFAGPMGTILEFQPPATRLVGRLRNLSRYFYEDEVLLLPFEAFDFRGKTFTANFPWFHFRLSGTSLNCDKNREGDELI